MMYFTKDAPFGVLKIYDGIKASQTQIKRTKEGRLFFFFLFFLPRNLFVYRLALTPYIWVTLFVFVFLKKKAYDDERVIAMLHHTLLVAFAFVFANNQRRQ